MNPAREWELDETIQILERTPRVLRALLGGELSEAWVTADEGPATWSPIVIVGHLIHGEETDWIPRARITIEDGPTRPFVPFDRFAQLERFGEWPLSRLLERFEHARAASLETLRSWDLTAEHLASKGRHPELGEVTLRQLLASWAVHDLGHLAQITRVMARRYREAVGPWSAYLPVLRPRETAR